MSQQPSFQFQPTKGPGPNFRTAPASSVKEIVFQLENASTLTNPQVPPNYVMASNSQSTENDMGVSYSDTTMTKLTDLPSYLDRQTKKEPSLVSDSTDSDSDSGDSGGTSVEAMDEDDVDHVPAKVKRGPRDKYRSYQPNQWQSVVDNITLHLGQISISEASRLAGINERTGRKVMQKYMDDPDAGIPVNLQPCGGGAGRPCKLNEIHTPYIEKFFGDSPDAYVKELQKAIKKDFNGLEVSETTLERHIKKHCCLSLKRLRAQPQARYERALLEQRKQWVEEWPSREDFLKQAVFVDEAGFNLHMRQLYGWSPRGKKGKNGGKEGDKQKAEFKKPPVIKVPNHKGMNLSVI
ncbi:hypothetical protein BGZ82_004366, partial [Podila clonocystis]